MDNRESNRAMRARFHGVLLSAGLLSWSLVASACGGSSPNDFAVVTDAAGFSVGLVTDGDEPRVTLRVDTEPGTAQAVRMVVSQSQVVSAGDMTQSIKTSQTMDVTYTVTDLSDDLVTMEAHYDDMVIDSGSGSAELDRAIVDAFVGITATGQLTDRGSIVSLEFPRPAFDVDIPGVPPSFFEELTDGMFESVEENASSLSLPTPVHPVGPGASWFVANEASIMGIPMRLESTITITEVTEDRAIGDIDQTLTYLPGEVEMFGASVTIDGGEMIGSGTITYLLDGGIVPLVNMDMEGWLTMVVTGETVEQTMSLQQQTQAR